MPQTGLTDLNDPELSHESVQPGKDKGGLEVPPHHRLLLEVLGQVGPAAVIGVLVALADPEGLVQFFQTLLRLHTQDLLCHKGMCLHTFTEREESVTGYPSAYYIVGIDPILMMSWPFSGE